MFFLFYILLFRIFVPLLKILCDITLRKVLSSYVRYAAV